MTGYLVSLLMGLAVGVAYGVLEIRSPAPPLIALVGLLGMVLGEQGSTCRNVTSRRPPRHRLVMSGALPNKPAARAVCGPDARL
jgi:XapX domain-containing protein